MNIFEQFNQEKETQRTLIKQAADNRFITDEQRREFEQKLDNDVLTIGVIGQMKAGKSTFLNAFVFERDVLPAATTPMTAALTVITYGPEEKIEVEFYTCEEWDEQRLTAQRELTPDSSEAEKSKVQAAQELVEKSARIGSRLPELLGTKRSDTLDKLIEYVGADGEFVSITKSVKIYYPKEYLKGVEIVDTPGFNDPIVSREERTKEIRATVASLRLDAIVAAGFGISRSRAADDISSDKVKLNWQSAGSASKNVRQGDVLSMRGRGRVEVTEVRGQTKKGRTVVVLHRYF